VKVVRHCGDTYFVTTGDGKTHKIWEFNLRLKTDTSTTGPAPGKPVIVGAGMQGDRASIVFASLREIGELVKEQCG
jgi:cytochrome c